MSAKKREELDWSPALGPAETDDNGVTFNLGALPRADGGFNVLIALFGAGIVLELSTAHAAHFASVISTYATILETATSEAEINVRLAAAAKAHGRAAD